MARRRKGRNVSGWVVIDKPAGMTSTSVVNKVRWAFDALKAGHAGTLDPEATGVLAVALGEATKTVPFVTDALKSYDFTVRWGEATTTDDAEGETIERSDARPTEPEIKRALGAFVGEIEQIPPRYSAVKIDGERAYTLAREGQNVDIAARPLWVESLLLTDVPDKDHAAFELTCGKGGYVRAIARDLGSALGCLGHVVALRRVWSGPFEIKDAVSLRDVEALARTDEIDRLLLPIEAGLTELPQFRCADPAAARLRNGNAAEVYGADAEFGDLAWVSYEGRPLAVGEYRAGTLQPSRVFVL